MVMNFLSPNQHLSLVQNWLQTYAMTASLMKDSTRLKIMMKIWISASPTTTLNSSSSQMSSPIIISYSHKYWRKMNFSQRNRNPDRRMSWRNWALSRSKAHRSLSIRGIRLIRACAQTFLHLVSARSLKTHLCAIRHQIRGRWVRLVPILHKNRYSRTIASISSILHSR